MKSEDIKRLLMNEFQERELNNEELENTLEYFAETYHNEQQQVKNTVDLDDVSGLLEKYTLYLQNRLEDWNIAFNDFDSWKKNNNR